MMDNYNDDHNDNIMDNIAGIPWTLHSWIRTLLTAQLGGLTNILDELLQVRDLPYLFTNPAVFFLTLFKTPLTSSIPFENFFRRTGSYFALL